MTHLEILVEEPSAEAALTVLVPGIVGDAATFELHPHNGRPDLLKKLPRRLKAYARWIRQADVRLLVLVDRDRDDCIALKQRLVGIAADAGIADLVTNRIAIEEIEAWFLGDAEALRASYPGLPASLGNEPCCRRPDEVTGGTWECLERVLKGAGYFSTGLRKIEFARTVAPRMDPERNTSPSFQAFRRALLSLAGQAR